MQRQDWRNNQWLEEPGSGQEQWRNPTYPQEVREEARVEEAYSYYARLLNRWGALGGRSVKTDLLQIPNAGNNQIALARAEVRGHPGLFVGYGSANPSLLGPAQGDRVMEYAELLAKIDALSAAFRTIQPRTGDGNISRMDVGDRQSGRTFLPFRIPAELAARQKIDLDHRPQGEGARIYQYFHGLVQQMEQRARQLQEQDLRLLHQVAQQGQDLSFYTYTQALVMMSHAIEDEFVQKQLAAPFYAGFQYLSRLLPQEPRYRAILRSAQRVVVFGIADWSPWYDPRLVLVPINLQPGTGLEHFWFVVVQGRGWKSALLAEHMDGGFAAQPARRRYRGFWTFDPVIVERIAGTLEYARRLLPGAPAR